MAFAPPSDNRTSQQMANECLRIWQQYRHLKPEARLKIMMIIDAETQGRRAEEDSKTGRKLVGANNG